MNETWEDILVRQKYLREMQERLSNTDAGREVEKVLARGGYPNPEDND